MVMARQKRTRNHFFIVALLYNALFDLSTIFLNFLILFLIFLIFKLTFLIILINIIDFD